MLVTNLRFIERDYYKKLMQTNSQYITDDQMEQLLDHSAYSWLDLTFKFYENGSLTIIDNHTDLPFPLSDLKGAAYDFYVRQRIYMIRVNLEAKILQSA